MQEKTRLLEEIFSKNKSEKEIYNEIISFSKRASPFPPEQLLKENLVTGCQSELYLTHIYKDGKIQFFIHISASHLCNGDNINSGVLARFIIACFLTFYCFITKYPSNLLWDRFTIPLVYCHSNLFP